MHPARAGRERRSSVEAVRRIELSILAELDGFLVDWLVVERVGDNECNDLVVKGKVQM